MIVLSYSSVDSANKNSWEDRGPSGKKVVLRAKLEYWTGDLVMGGLAALPCSVECYAQQMFFASSHRPCQGESSVTSVWAMAANSETAGRMLQNQNPQSR
ncbi:hypothetical protein VTN00DRAFT_1071 [Thermoascus crustaceus]|uniref:uncharacterized protein n=1 Tax=Thermoascus crustaceus TaxID=5088 RepID=UPI0037440C11